MEVVERVIGSTPTSGEESLDGIWMRRLPQEERHIANVVLDALSSWVSDVESQPHPIAHAASVLDHGPSHRQRVMMHAARLVNHPFVPDDYVGRAAFLMAAAIRVHDIGFACNPAPYFPDLGALSTGSLMEWDRTRIIRRHHRIAATVLREMSRGALPVAITRHLSDAVASDALRGLYERSLRSVLALMSVVIAHHDASTVDIEAQVRSIDDEDDQQSSEYLPSDVIKYLISALRLADTLDRSRARLSASHAERDVCGAQIDIVAMCHLVDNATLDVNAYGRSICARLGVVTCPRDRKRQRKLHSFVARESERLQKEGRAIIGGRSGVRERKPIVIDDGPSVGEAELAKTEMLIDRVKERRKALSTIGLARILDDTLLSTPYFYSWVKITHPWGIVCNGRVACRERLLDGELHGAVAMDPWAWGLASLGTSGVVVTTWDELYKEYLEHGGVLRYYKGVADVPIFTRELFIGIKGKNRDVAAVNVHIDDAWVCNAEKYAQMLSRDVGRMGGRIERAIVHGCEAASKWLRIRGFQRERDDVERYQAWFDSDEGQRAECWIGDIVEILTELCDARSGPTALVVRKQKGTLFPKYRILCWAPMWCAEWCDRLVKADGIGDGSIGIGVVEGTPYCEVVIQVMDGGRARRLARALARCDMTGICDARCEVRSALEAAVFEGRLLAIVSGGYCVIEHRPNGASIVRLRFLNAECFPARGAQSFFGASG